LIVLRTATIVGISAVAWIVAAVYFDETAVAAILGVGHILYWQNHRLEVKVNRLLDASGTFVADNEINN
jgi:hypothetical protein